MWAMVRYLVLLFAALSICLSIVVAGFWFDALQHGLRGISFTSDPGIFAVKSMPQGAASHITVGYVIGHDLTEGTRLSWRNLGHPIVDTRADWERMGFGYKWNQRGFSNENRIWTVFAPHWAVALALLLLPAPLVAIAGRRRHENRAAMANDE